MKGTLIINGTTYSLDYSKPLDIAIPLTNGTGVCAFGVDPYSAQPFSSGGFIGSLEEGSPVNFYDIKINPHGNGTHTESMLHIDKRGQSINETLKQYHFLAMLCTVNTKQTEDGDSIVDLESINFSKLIESGAEALILRTLPNDRNKCRKNYSGSNPPYFDNELIQEINKTQVKHLLTDLPSVDKEVDGGVLLSHNSFWNTKGKTMPAKTITELIYVDNAIEDGLFLLNLQIISVDIDASPSKPILYRLEKNEIA